MIVSAQPPLMPPESPAKSSTTYRLQVPLGLVPLKTPEILKVLAAVKPALQSGVNLHLFGISRCDHIPQFAKHGVTSFDSTSPLRQAFKDDKDAVGGFMLIKANSLADATAIAKGCPIFNNGGTVELRPVEKM